VSFDVAADAYDRFMGGWSRLLSAQFAHLAGVEPGTRVLDVGCGPGALTAELVRRLGPEDVAAVDPSQQFVEAARARHPGVAVRQASAEALPYPDDAFDAALAQLVVHFMSDPVGGLGEMARVTRPRGTVAACVWDYGGGRHPLWPFWEAVRALDPGAVDESRLAGARQGHLVELFEAAGLRELQEAELTATRHFASIDDWWQPFLSGVGPAGKYVASLSPERRAELRVRCRSMLPADSFEIVAVAWAARGVV